VVLVVLQIPLLQLDQQVVQEGDLHINQDLHVVLLLVLQETHPQQILYKDGKVVIFLQVLLRVAKEPVVVALGELVEILVQEQLMMVAPEE